MQDRYDELLEVNRELREEGGGGKYGPPFGIQLQQVEPRLARDGRAGRAGARGGARQRYLAIARTRRSGLGEARRHAAHARGAARAGRRRGPSGGAGGRARQRRGCRRHHGALHPRCTARPARPGSRGRPVTRARGRRGRRWLPSTAPAPPRARSMRPPPLPLCCCCCCCCYHCYCCCCCRRRRRQPLQSARLSGPRGAARRSHARRCADSWRLPRGRGGAAPHRAGQWLQGAAAHARALEPRRPSLAPCACRGFRGM
jgi:hypothetical protein